jgi:hypothetical protein
MFGERVLKGDETEGKKGVGPDTCMKEVVGEEGRAGKG